MRIAASDRAHLWSALAIRQVDATLNAVADPKSKHFVAPKPTGHGEPHGGKGVWVLGLRDAPCRAKRPDFIEAQSARVTIGSHFARALCEIGGDDSRAA
jgi:hypothetical protein